MKSLSPAPRPPLSVIRSSSTPSSRLANAPLKDTSTQAPNRVQSPPFPTGSSPLEGRRRKTLPHTGQFANPVRSALPTAAQRNPGPALLGAQGDAAAGAHARLNNEPQQGRAAPRPHTPNAQRQIHVEKATEHQHRPRGKRRRAPRHPNPRIDPARTPEHAATPPPCEGAAPASRGHGPRRAHALAQSHRMHTTTKKK